MKRIVLCLRNEPNYFVQGCSSVLTFFTLFFFEVYMPTNNVRNKLTFLVMLVLIEIH